MDAATRLLLHLRSRGYESAIIPSDNVTVKVSLNIQDADYNPDTGLLLVTAWERYEWKDERLTWNPDDFEGVKVLHIPDTDVWTPDMRLYNAYGNSHKVSPVNTVVTAQGSVNLIPPSVFSVRCNPLSEDDSRSDKGDRNTIKCNLKFGSWTYDGNMVTLSTDKKSVDLHYYKPYGPAVIKSSKTEVNSITYECCPEPYMSYDVTLYLDIVDKD